MKRPYFPVPLDKMSATLRFHRSEEAWNANGFHVRSLPLSHPGGVLAYRIMYGGPVFVFATDCELFRAGSQDGTAAKASFSRWSPREREFFSEADLLAVDCQYSDEKYEAHRGQGHNSTSMAAALAMEFQPRALALIHHDPGSTDEAVNANADAVRARLAAPISVFAAHDGLSLQVGAGR